MKYEDDVRWITVRGNHIPIKPGQSVQDAISERFDDTDDIDIDIELEDADVKIPYNKIYYYEDRLGYKYVIKDNEIDDYFSKGYQIHEIDIDLEMKDKMEELIKEFAPDNNLITMTTRFQDYLKFNSDVMGSEKNLIIEEFRKKAIEACKIEANKYLKTLPRSSDKSSDYALKQNSNGYVESMEYPSRSKERDWYTSNCQRCIIAYEMRRRGYDVEADKYLGDEDRIYNSRISMTLAFLDYDNSLHTKDYNRQLNGELYPSRKALIKDMEKNMLKEGEGARFVLSWYWKNCDYGHTVNAEVINGEIKVFDSQVNKTYGIQELIDDKSLKPRTLDCTRVDNLSLSNRLEDLIKWKK